LERVVLAVVAVVAEQHLMAVILFFQASHLQAAARVQGLEIVEKLLEELAALAVEAVVGQLL
jgi:hypothetical protein